MRDSKPRTTVSTEGQVILPKAVRKKRRRGPGTRLVVGDADAGVLLKAAPLFPPTRLEDVCGMLRHEGPTVAIAEMHEGVLEEAARRHARGRY